MEYKSRLIPLGCVTDKLVHDYNYRGSPKEAKIVAAPTHIPTNSVEEKSSNNL